MNKKGLGKTKWLLSFVFIIYVVELIWFFYSQIISKLINRQEIDFASKELAIILIIGLLSILLFFILKRSRKVGSIFLGVLTGSAILFCLIAPLLDVYIPVIWKIINNF